MMTDRLVSFTRSNDDLVDFARQMQRHRETLGLDRPRAHCPTCTCKEHQ